MDLSAGIEVKKEIYINRPSCTFRIISVVYGFCNMMVFVKKNLWAFDRTLVDETHYKILPLTFSKSIHLTIYTYKSFHSNRTLKPAFIGYHRIKDCEMILMTT